MPERVAAIDVGSNAIRFSAAESDRNGAHVVAQNRWAEAFGMAVTLCRNAQCADG